MSKLYLVPTPIGNFDDITLRALQVLRDVDVVLAEDTRTSGNLLRHFEISKPMLAFHKFNEHKVLDGLINRLIAGETMALVSDAGTPAISDPGFLLVRECVSCEIPVECLPGATAFVPALVDSALACDRFCFEGFLPQKKGRNKKLQSLLAEGRTMVFYESPFRVVKTLEALSDVFGPDRLVSVSREISKLHEETVRGTLSDVLQNFKGRSAVKGEFVLVLEGADGYQRRLTGLSAESDEDFDETDVPQEMV